MSLTEGGRGQSRIGSGQGFPSTSGSLDHLRPSLDRFPFDIRSLPQTGTCPAHGASCVEGNITNNAIVGRLKLASVEQLASLPDHHPVWARTAHYLAMLCLNLTLICSFKKIVIGGGIVVFRKDVILPLVRKKFAELLGGYLRHERLEAGMPAGTGLDEYIVASRFKTGLGLLAAITAPCGGE